MVLLLTFSSRRLVKLGEFLKSIPSPSGQLDVVKFDGEKFIKIQEAWNVVRVKNDPPAWAKWLWGSKVPRKTLVLGWKCFQFGLLTHDAFQNRGVFFTSRCSLCLNDIETANHLLFECSFSKVIWNSFGLQSISSLADVIDVLDAKTKAIILLTLEALWFERNLRTFEGRSRLPDDIVLSITSVLSIVM